MITTRGQARAAVVAALQGLSLFKTVSNGVLDSFGKQSPIAVVRSTSHTRSQEARNLWTYRYSLAVTIYVDTDHSTPAQVEAKLDTLVEAVVNAIETLDASSDDDITVQESLPPDGDVLQRPVDGGVYRVERIPIIWESEG